MKFSKARDQPDVYYLKNVSRQDSSGRQIVFTEDRRLLVFPARGDRKAVFIFKPLNKQKYSAYSGALLCALLFLCAGLLGASCKGPEAGDATKSQPAVREMTDDLGHKVALPQTVNRAISLAPNITEIIFAIDGGSKVVGDTTFCNYPEEAKAIAKVGDTINPNLEAIVALKPDVVFVSTASQIETFSKRLEEQKIAVFVTDPKDLDGVYKSIAVIGDIIGKKEKAEDLITALKKRVADVETKTEQSPGYRVFVQIYEEPLYTAGGPSFITDLIERAGGFSVTANINDPYPKLSEETALALQPDVIIISEMTGGEHKLNSVFKNSPAMRNKKVFPVDSDLLTRPGPRSVDALEQIAEKLNGKN